MDAVQELNVKAKNWRDLMTDAPFVRADLRHLQDPADLEKCNYSRCVAGGRTCACSRWARACMCF
jgi:hypothetical protein